jgi:spermidine dehydrogenase
VIDFFRTFVTGGFGVQIDAIPALLALGSGRFLLHMVRVPCKPGLPARQQRRMGRMELYTTPFEVFEHNIRAQLGRMLALGGFDPDRDLEAITVNRWPHGYADYFSDLEDPDWAPDQRPNVVGRQRFGRIAIANSDAAASAQTQAAIDEAYRAVTELLSG